MKTKLTDDQKAEIAKAAPVAATRDDKFNDFWQEMEAEANRLRAAKLPFSAQRIDKLIRPRR